MKFDLLIDGEPAPAGNGNTFDRLNPMTGDIATSAAACDAKDAKRAVDSAHDAFQAWARTGPAERRAILTTAADVLESKSALFSELMTAETGATKV